MEGTAAKLQLQDTIDSLHQSWVLITIMKTSSTTKIISSADLYVFYKIAPNQTTCESVILCEAKTLHMTQYH